MVRSRKSSSSSSRIMKKSFAAALPFAFPVLLTVINFSGPAANSSTKPPQALRVEYSALVTGPATLPQHSVVLTVEDGDTLDSVFVEGGLDRAQSAQLNREFGRYIDLRRLRPGHLVRFHYDESGVVDSVEMKVSGWGEIDATREDGRFRVTGNQAQAHEIETVVAAGIDTSLYEALRLAGESPQLVQQLVDVFQWDIDFFALQRGDSFSLVVKKRFSGSEPVGYGAIEAARFTHNGQTFEAFRQETPDGRAGYYARNGSPLRKQFLRAPLQFTRITSHFSKSRFHPLLHYFRPHHGVDYGAPTGTPVMTTADGVVVEARYKHGEGNLVRVRHTSRIDTYYLHLSRFAKDIRPGRRVTQGDVIGYVGMTGLATGPHLDYRVCDGGTFLDPLKLKSITPDPLRGNVVAEFRTSVGRLSPRLAAASRQIAENGPKRRALF
jgi:murein DD-endopeptidase MepM/ murein hydrolase activator NlpD